MHLHGMHVLEHVVGVGRFHFTTGIQEIFATIFGFIFFFNVIIEMIKNFIFFLVYFGIIAAFS